MNRLVSATLYDGPNGGRTQKQQSYTFDAFGNLTNIAGTSGRATPTSAQTNRLNGTGTVYDAAGNLTHWNSAVYQYDAFNQMTHMTSGAEEWVYLYTADDERLWSYSVPRNSSRWALRDLRGKVLREYLTDSGWSVGTDYIYRDGLLLAAETQTGQRHFHLDHLGTPRLITRASGYPAGYHVYYPFGEEATAFKEMKEKEKQKEQKKKEEAKKASSKNPFRSKEEDSMKSRGKIILGVFLGLLVLVWLGIANPFNFFVRRSEHFSMKEFQAIKPGMRIEYATARLGAPIAVVHSRLDLGCPNCIAYYFLGDPPSWLVSFQEAWLLVDNHGRVVSATVNAEP